MSRVSTLITMSSAAQHAPTASWDVPCDWLTEEKKTKGSTRYTGTTQKWTPLSGTTLKDTGKGKSSQLAELQAVHIFINLFVRKNGQMCNYSLIHGEWIGLMVRDLDREWLENWWERHLWKRCVEICLSKWAKDVEILVPRVNAHQKVTLCR